MVTRQATLPAILESLPPSPIHSPTGSQAPLLDPAERDTSRFERASGLGRLQPPPWARRQARGTYASFFAFGATYGGWEARMAELKHQLRSDDRTLGGLLCVAVVAQLSSSWFAGALVRQVGVRPGMALVALAFPLAVAALCSSRSLAEALPAMALLGAAGGLYDNQINSAAGIAEEAGVHAAMTTAHGLASLGSLVGGSLAAAAEHFDVSLELHLSLVGLSLALFGLWASQQLAPNGSATTDEEDALAGAAALGPEAPVSPPLLRSALAWRLALTNTASSLAEGALYDWTSIYLRDALHQPANVAAGGYVGVVGAMAASRLIVGPYLQRLPLTPTLIGAGAIAAISLGGTLVLQRPIPAIAGLMSSGASLAIVTPRIVREMGRRFGDRRNEAMAWLATGQSTGFFAGPPLIGLLAGSVGLSAALYAIPALAAVTALLASCGFDAPQDGRRRQRAVPCSST